MKRRYLSDYPSRRDDWDRPQPDEPWSSVLLNFGWLVVIAVAVGIVLLAWTSVDTVPTP